MKSQFQYVLSADYYPPINKQLGICNQELSDQFCRSFEPASTNPENVTRITKFETESVEPIIFVHSKQDFDSERFNQIFNRTALNKSGQEKSKSLLLHHYLLILFKKKQFNCKTIFPDIFTLNDILDPNSNPERQTDFLNDTFCEIYLSNLIFDFYCKQICFAWKYAVLLNNNNLLNIIENADRFSSNVIRLKIFCINTVLYCVCTVYKNAKLDLIIGYLQYIVLFYSCMFVYF